MAKARKVCILVMNEFIYGNPMYYMAEILDLTLENESKKLLKVYNGLWH